MKLKITSISVLLINLMFNCKIGAQETTGDTLARTVESIQQSLDIKNRLKFSGYIQSQFQVSDSMGQGTFAGPNFPSFTDKRFSVRRGRLKAQYDGTVNDNGISTSQYVLQFDVTESGVNIKDAYAKFTDPWSGWVSITAGMQNRPFGYEIVYSSSMRESPERGRMSQIIFRNERDLGAMVTIQGSKTSSWNWIKLEGGLFNGNGAPSTLATTGSDFDKKKDFIGRLGITRTSKSETIKYGIGASYYSGGFRMDNDTIWSVNKDDAGVTGFKIESAAGNKGKTYPERKYTGFDAQFSIDWLIGLTTLRGEFISGDQPTIYSATDMQRVTTSPSAAVNAPIYKRKFNGAYFYFLQNISTTPFQAIVKYDWYDPNTDVEKDGIGKSVANGLKATNAADIKYTTLGLGLAYRWDANVKLTAYYDMVANEKSPNLSGYNQDLNDNVFTLRAQIKF
jgi:hypothetical protein